MALTDAKIRAAKPTDKAYKLTDGAGMFLLVHPNGSRYWRLRYRILGKEKTLALGVYPELHQFYRTQPNSPHINLIVWV
ncbi:Arm DNA-binding domain-containing protein [Escherichia coli]|uniref:Arm DNA-binding domain-containing protein n=1 Tax=Escherichia coli TaxID=562 RepID=UPI000D593C64